MPDPFSAHRPPVHLQLLPWTAGEPPRVRWRQQPAERESAYQEDADRVRERLEAFALPPPFLKVHSVQSIGEGLFEVVSDAFVGVSAARAVVGLKHAGRRLPLDVWFGLAERMLQPLSLIPLVHPWWRAWAGPHTLGVDFDGNFVLVGGFHGQAIPPFAARPWAPVGPQSDWLDSSAPNGERPELLGPLRVWSACRALVWMLDPFPLRFLVRDTSFELEWSHPEVSPALAAVLEEGLSRRATDGLQGLHQAIAQTVGVAAAPMERIKAVLFGAAEEALIARVREVAAHDEALPERWKGGTLLVELDRTLEHIAPVAACPVDPRVKVAAGTAADEPLLATRTLELQVFEGDQLLRKIPLAESRALPPRVALPVGHVAKGPVRLRLVHPEQRSQYVELEATLDAEGWALPGALEPEQQRQLARFWSALVAQAPRAKTKKRKFPVPFVPSHAGGAIAFATFVATVMFAPSLLAGLALLALYGLGVLSGGAAVKLAVGAALLNLGGLFAIALFAPESHTADD